MKNNKLNLKYFILVVFIIAVIFSIPTARAEINNNISDSNQQLIILLKQLITLLIQQVEELTKQLTAQQQAINNLNNAVFQPISTQSTTPALNSTIQQLASPYFVVEISSDKNAVQNNGVDYATLTIIAKLSDGQILPNKAVKINNQTYISDSNGIIIYKTTPTTRWYQDPCGNYSNTILIAITEDGNKIFSKSISINNIQQIQKGSGIFTCP